MYFLLWPYVIFVWQIVALLPLYKQTYTEEVAQSFAIVHCYNSSESHTFTITSYKYVFHSGCMPLLVPSQYLTLDLKSRKAI